MAFEIAAITNKRESEISTHANNYNTSHNYIHFKVVADFWIDIRDKLLETSFILYLNE